MPRIFAVFGSLRFVLLGVLTLSATCLSSNASALTISGTPLSVVFANKSYSFTPSVSGSNGHALAFSIVNKPTWASFSSTTGKLFGTPTLAQAGWTTHIVISVSDGASSAALSRFDLLVRYDKVPPTITGTPPTSVSAGSAYKFQPVAKDAAGNPMYFTITNKPDWATFSIVTGLLSGTPSNAQAGTYANIVIRTTDDNESASLAPFSITVKSAAPPGGTATVSWDAPTENTNGSALTNLAGYWIHYGTSPANLSQLVEVAGTTVTSYTVDNLAAATWYFAITAYTTSGEMSAQSAIASKTID
ncbi:MAG TPA: putative Ig domain-containing protein [Steroidobacteraceae bacterium]|jgi:hypothetical protein|nr:putative Ig domain-containing protein [Steroidobacteraceae bacterium]